MSQTGLICINCAQHFKAHAKNQRCLFGPSYLEIDALVNDTRADKGVLYKSYICGYLHCMHVWGTRASDEEYVTRCPKCDTTNRFEALHDD